MIQSDIVEIIFWLISAKIFATLVYCLFRIFTSDKIDNFKIEFRALRQPFYIVLLLILTLYFFPSVYEIKVDNISYMAWDVQTDHRSNYMLSFRDKDGIHYVKFAETTITNEGYQKTGINVNVECNRTNMRHIRGFPVNINNSQIEIDK